MGNVRTWTDPTADLANLCDAALVECIPGVDPSNAPLRLGATPMFGDFVIPDRGSMEGTDVGTYTPRRIIQGKLVGVHTDLKYVLMDTRTFAFYDVVEYAPNEPMIEGDSGAAVLQESTRRALGLHFAGGRQHAFLFHHRLGDSLKAQHARTGALVTSRQTLATSTVYSSGTVRAWLSRITPR